MILPSTLSDPIETARASIRQVNPILDGRHHLHNAEGQLAGIRQWVVTTPAIEIAIQQALQAITPLYKLHNSVSVDATHLEEPKAEFNRRVDGLVIALSAAKANEEANALGLGW